MDGPVYVVAVELDFLLVRQLGVGKELALGILAHGGAHDGLGADAFMDIRRKDIPYAPGNPNTYARPDLDEWFESNKYKPMV